MSGNHPPDQGSGGDRAGIHVFKDRHKKKPYEAGGVVVYDGRVVLRLTDEQNWIFPKGKRRKGEKARAAAIREVVEETGLTVEIVAKAGQFVEHVDGKPRRIAFYLMRGTGHGFDYEHHARRDTFLVNWRTVDTALRPGGYQVVWKRCREQVIALCEESVD